VLPPATGDVTPRTDAHSHHGSCVISSANPCELVRICANLCEIVRTRRESVANLRKPVANPCELGAKHSRIRRESARTRRELARIRECVRRIRECVANFRESVANLREPSRERSQNISTISNESLLSLTPQPPNMRAVHGWSQRDPSKTHETKRDQIHV
jgi:hypothetical protein